MRTHKLLNTDSLPSQHALAAFSTPTEKFSTPTEKISIRTQHLLDTDSVSSRHGSTSFSIRTDCFADTGSQTKLAVIVWPGHSTALVKIRDGGAQKQAVQSPIGGSEAVVQRWGGAELSSQVEPATQELGRAVLGVGGGQVVAALPELGKGVAHYHTHARELPHGHIVVAITDGH